MNALAEWLAVPGAWTTPFIIAGIMIASYGLSQIEHIRSAAAGFQVRPSNWTIRTRIVLGHVIAIPIALITFTMSRFVSEGQQLLLLALTLLIYLGVGWVIPRRPLVEAQRERKQIRLLIPSFTSYLITSLSGYEPRPRTLERYVNRQDTRIAPMQKVVAKTLQLVQEGKLPFQALLSVAQDYDIDELKDIAMLLAQSETKGTDPTEVLKDIKKTLDQILDEQFRTMIERRKLWLLLVSALAVVAVLAQILFVVIAGSDAIQRFFGS